MSTESVENVGSPSEVENQFSRPWVLHPLNLHKLIEELPQIVSINNTSQYHINYYILLYDLVAALIYLSVEKGSYGHIPSSVSGHH